MLSTDRTSNGCRLFRVLPVGVVVGAVLGLLWSIVPAWASDLVTHFGDCTIQNWQLEQGLPQISVTCIAQSPDGYLWVGTFNGLARFDGVGFTVFNERNTPALGNSAITHLQVDEQGALWILTLKGGLVRMAAGQFTMVWKENAQSLVGGVEVPNRAGRGVFLLDRQFAWHRVENVGVLPVGERFPTNEAPVFLFENSCLGWVAQAGKIRRPNEVLLSALAEEGKKERVVLAMHSGGARQAGGYWVAGSNGLFRFNEGQLSSRVATLPAEKHKHYIMQEDGQGTLWAGQWGAGVFRLNADGSWLQFSAASGLKDKNVNCLFRDREGSLWVGTGQAGLHRIRPRVFQMYATESGPKTVMGVTQDRHGRMWFAVNGGGVNTFTDGKLKPVMEPAILRKYPLAYSILADHEDAVWIGLYGELALRWQGDAVTTYNVGEDTGEGSREARTPGVLYEDHSGVVWLGCRDMLFRYEKGQFRRYMQLKNPPSDAVVALAEDRSGTLYLGAEESGLYCLRDGRFTHLTEREGLMDEHLASLCVDEENTLWIGTVYGGLMRFKNGSFRRIGLKDGLPTLTIGRMLEDGLGNLWLGSNRGIIRVNRLALNEYLEGTRKAVTWDLFGLSEGLATIGCAGPSQPAVWKAKDGKLWFSTIKGAAVVDPKQIPFNRLPPPVRIEAVAMDDEVQISPLSELVVPSDRHRIEIRFTGLSLAAPEKVRFRYRLEAFDRNWVEAGTRRIAYYSGLQPGTYNFRVTACNNDGVWNDAGASLGLLVLPPWWMTGWFRVLVVLGFAGLVFGWFEHRLQRLRRERTAQTIFAHRLIDSQEQERKRIAAELHDSLGQDLLVIKNRAILGLREPATVAWAAEQLGEISRMASHTLEEVRQISRNLRPYQIDRLGLTKALETMAGNVSRASGLPCSIQVASLDGLLAPQLEIHFYRIAQELLNNVVKHSVASQCCLRVQHQDQRIILSVEDNGRGFDLAASSQRSLGLSAITERVRILGGTWHCDSQPGQGTRWRIEIPCRLP